MIFSKGIDRIFSNVIGSYDPKVKGSYEINVQPYKALYLHCNQISTTNNLFNGKPSTILGVIPIAMDGKYGSSIFREYEKIEKPLECNTINEFQFSLKDYKGNIINNHNLPIIISIQS